MFTVLRCIFFLVTNIYFYDFQILSLQSLGYFSMKFCNYRCTLGNVESQHKTTGNIFQSQRQINKFLRQRSTLELICSFIFGLELQKSNPQVKEYNMRWFCLDPDHSMASSPCQSLGMSSKTRVTMKLQYIHLLIKTPNLNGTEFYDSQ